MDDSGKKTGAKRTTVLKSIPAMILIMLLVIAGIWKFGAIAVTITLVVGLCYLFMVHSNKVVQWLKVCFFLLGVITFANYTVNHWKDLNGLRVKYTNITVDVIKKGLK